MSCCSSFNIPTIFTWKSPIETAIFAVAVNLIYFGSVISGTGLLYLLFNYSFFFIVFAFLFIKVKALLENVQSGEEEKREDDKTEYVFISAETIQNWILGINEITTEVTQRIKNITEPSQFTYFVKLLVVTYFVGVLGQILAFKTLLWFVLNGFFAFAFLLVNKSAMDKIQPIISVAKDTTKGLYSSVIQKIPKYQYAQQ